MCNFYGYKVDRETYIQLRKIEKQFGTDYALDIVRSGFEYSDIAVITATANKEDWIERKMHWEFIPNWVNSMEELKMIRKGIDPKTGKRAVDAKTGKPKPIIPWLNAKAENLISSPMWRDAARNRRCLIVAHHFFEWRWYKPDDAKKELSYPYIIQPVNDAKPFLMAGIWTPWTDKTTGEMMDTVAIVTASANGKMKQIHNKKLRQPTIFTSELAEKWIFDELTDNEILETAAYQWPSTQMDAYTIARDFKTNPDPLQHFEYKELPDLIMAD